MGKADLHIHTIYSWDGNCSVEAVLKQAAHIAELDVIAITDHDEIQGALEAEKLASRYGIEVIPGVEITTADGHLLALFVRERIASGLPVVETVLRVRELGGLCIVPHLEAKHSQGMSRQAVRGALRDVRVQQTLLGMETFNAGLFDKSANQKAFELSEELLLAKTGSSDAHLIWMVGQGITTFPGRTANDLKLALQSRTTNAQPVNPTAFPLIMLSWLRGYLLRKAGWVEYNRYPEAPIKLERIPSLAQIGINSIAI